MIGTIKFPQHLLERIRLHLPGVEGNAVDSIEPFPLPRSLQDVWLSTGLGRHYELMRIRPWTSPAPLHVN
jgi:hypothetical protein